MARYLSPEWLQHAAGVVSNSSRATRIPTDVSLSVRQVVQGGPEGDVTYTVRFQDGDIALTPGGESEVDVEVTSAYDTAVAISKGDLSPALALAAGVLRVSGRVGLLAEHRDAWSALDDLLAPVRAATEY